MPDDRTRYLEALHAMQSGVKFDIETDPLKDHSQTEKHLRVGINSNMVEHGALVRVLIAKGVFTLAEYEAELAKGMEAEAARYEKLLTDRLGSKVNLA